MTDLQTLIARLEAADEGSADLDRAIEAHLFPHYATLIFRDKWDSPHRTRSLDAALTLVPEIWRVYAIQEQYIDPPCKWFVGLDRRREHRESMIGKSSTPALALCVAALKAREAT